MDNNIRLVPIQQVCLLCPNELPARDGTEGLASRLCRKCIQMIREQVFQEVVANPKIVRVQ